MRRRNVPCSPCGSGSSGCGCCPPKSIKKINNIEPDDNGKFEVRAGSNVTITDITNGIEISASASANDTVKSVEIQGEGTVLPDANGKITILVGANMDIDAYPMLHQIAIASTATALTKKNHTLASANWDNNNQLTITEAEITTTNDVFVSPDPSDWSDYNSAGIRAVSQGTGTLTFECETVPTSDIGVNLVIGRLNV